MEYKKITMGVQYPHGDFLVFMMFRRCSACFFCESTCLRVRHVLHLFFMYLFVVQAVHGKYTMNTSIVQAYVDHDMDL